MNGHPFRQLVARTSGEGTTLVNARGEALKVSMERNQAGLLTASDQPIGTSTTDVIVKGEDGLSLAANDLEIPHGIQNATGTEEIRGVADRSKKYTVQVEFIGPNFSAMHAEVVAGNVTGSVTWSIKTYTPKFRVRYKDQSGNSASIDLREYAI